MFNKNAFVGKNGILYVYVFEKGRDYFEWRNGRHMGGKSLWYILILYARNYLEKLR
jgi:hypothetical protein